MDQFQVGFRFLPTEEELVDHHLMGKVQGNTDNCVIPDLKDIYTLDPWDLPGLHLGISNVPSDGWNWFFVCPSPYVAQNGKRVKRKTRSGQWKITCQRDDLKARHTKVLIGTKRILVFYKGRTKIGWVMHEYHLNHELLNGYSSTLQMPYILCHLKRKPSESLDTPPSLTDNPAVASQHGSTEDTDQESSFQATMESLPPIQSLYNNLPDYDSYTSFNPQHYAYGDSQGNDFW